MRKNVVIIFICLFIATGCGNKAIKEDDNVIPISVPIANYTIEKDQIITEDMVKFIFIPDYQLDEKVIVSSDEIIGKKAKEKINQYEYFFSSTIE